MRLAAVLESYPPGMMAGSEMAAEMLFRHLVAHGWEVRVHMLNWPDAEYERNGVKVVSTFGDWQPKAVYSHLYRCVPPAVQMARDWGVPTVYWTHANTGVPMMFDMVIANTETLAPGADVILHPVSPSSEYKVRRGGKVLRVGLSHQKGGPVFWDLAHRMPEHEFLGVIGGWGEQIVAEPPRNTQVWGAQTDIRNAYRQTRVLIMPSDEHETFGRTAIEACASGIPVIADPQPGLVEALGDAGIYAARQDVDCWEQLIRCLDDPGEYAYHSKLARQRAQYWDERVSRELAEVESMMRELAA